VVPPPVGEAVGVAFAAEALDAAFTAAMGRLGPFEPAPLLAVAVSGGSDSMALALLADAWARDRGGRILALIVDHGLRPASAVEAAGTRDRLAARGIAARVLVLSGLGPGTRLAERARAGRYAALEAACAEAGCLHLLTGHQRLDQAETLMMRALGSSGSTGLAGMAALTVLGTVRLLRPLLGQPPAMLRAWLQDRGVDWVEDPSNVDPRALRARLRVPARRADMALAQAARRAGVARARRERAIAAELAAHVSLRPEGFALLAPVRPSGRFRPEALAAVIQAVAGAPFPPASTALLSLAADPRPATLAGVRLLRAGRFGPGWLMVREPRAVAPAAPVRPGLLWDRRFRLTGTAPNSWHVAALGAAAARFGRQAGLPGAVLRTLPAVWDGNSLVAVPHLLYRAQPISDLCLTFEPGRPMAGAPFTPDAGLPLE